MKSASAKYSTPTSAYRRCSTASEWSIEIWLYEFCYNTEIFIYMATVKNEYFAFQQKKKLLLLLFLTTILFTYMIVLS